MRYTLLEIVQRVLESMESDEVSTVGETPESLAVANIVKECFYDIVGEFSFAENEGLYKLDASGNNLQPALMLVPSSVSQIQWLKYNKGETETDYDVVTFQDNEEFLYCTDSLDTTDANVSSMVVPINGKNFTFKFYTDRMPTYYTIFDEQYVIFDAYDSDIETTLQESRSLVYASLIPSFSLTDTWIPDLDPRQFQLLINEAKAQAFIELKQAANPKAEQKGRRNRIQAQRQKHDNNPSWSNQYHASFGRMGRNGYPRNSMQRAMRKGR